MYQHRIDACLLCDSVNISYAPSRYLILTQKDAILYEFNPYKKIIY